MSLMQVILFLYLLPLVISYICVRDLHFRGYHTAEANDVFAVLAPVVNMVLALITLCISIDLRVSKASITRVFFHLPKNKQGGG